MFVNHGSSSVFQASLIFLLLLYHTNWVLSSSKDIYWKKYTSPQIPFQLQFKASTLQTLTHTLSRNEATEKGQSSSFQSQHTFEAGKMPLSMKQTQVYGKTTKKSGGIGLQNYYTELSYTSCNISSTNCSNAETNGTKKDHHQRRGSERYETTQLSPTTSIPYPHSSSSRTKKRNNSKASRHLFIKENDNLRKKTNFLMNAVVVNINHASLHGLDTTETPSFLVSPSSPSMAQKSSLMQLDAFPLSVSTGQSTRVKSQVGKLLKSDVSLMKFDIKSINVENVERERETAESTPTPPLDLFLASKSEQQHLHNGKFHFKRRSSSSQKPIGNIIMRADKHSGGTIDTEVVEPSVGEYSYLSKGNDGKRKREKVKNSEHYAYGAGTRNGVDYSPGDVNNDSDFALTNVASVVKGENNNKPFTSNRSNKESGSTQLMAPITKNSKGKVGEKENRNFTVIVDVPIEKQKINLDHYPSFPLTSHQIGDQLSMPYVKHGTPTTAAGVWNGSNKGNINNTKWSRKIIKYATFASSVDNETQRKIAKGVALPTSEAAKTSSTGVVFTRSKVEKTTSVLERLSGVPGNNIHLQPGTTTTGLYSTTRNCSTSVSGKQARFPDTRKRTIEMTLSKENSYERNKSHVGNVNDSLNGWNSLRCKCKRHTKHGVHFTFLKNMQGKLALNSFNRTITSTTPSKSTETLPIDTTTYTTQKSQLAKLDTLIGTSSFELGKVMVGTQSESISAFDNSFDKTDQTISITSAEKKERNQRLNIPLSQQHHLKLANKRTRSRVGGIVNGATKLYPDFGQIESYKRIRREAVKENNLFNNLLRHQTVLISGKEIMSKFQPTTNNPPRNFMPTNIKLNFETTTARSKERADSPQNKRKADDSIDLLALNISKTEYLILDKFKNSKKTANRRTLLKHNELINVRTSNSSAHHHSNDAYRFLLATKNSAAASQTLGEEMQQQKLPEKMSKFIEQKGNNRESSERPNSSSMSVEFIPSTRAVQVKKLASSPPIFPNIKVASMKHGFDKLNGAIMARSAGRKWNFTDERTTAQGEGIFEMNHKFSSRAPLVNRKDEGGDSQTHGVLARQALIIRTATPTTWRNGDAYGYDSNDHKSTSMSSGNGGQKLMDTFPSSRSETEVITQLPQSPQQRENVSIHNDSEARVKTTFTDLFNENQKIRLRKKIKRNTDCTGATTAFSLNTDMADDGCGNGESSVILARRNLSGKLIPLKENLVVLNFPQTGDERTAVSPVMNVNKNNNTYYVINPKRSIVYQVDGKVYSFPAPDTWPSMKGEPETSFSRPEQIRSENGKMTQKIADVSDKVLAGEHNFVQKQWMNVVKGWKNIDNHLNGSNKSTRAKFSYNSQDNNELSSMTTVRSVNEEKSVLQNSSDYDLPIHEHNSSAVRQLMNMQPLKKTHKIQENVTSFTKELDAHTVISSASIERKPSMKAEINDEYKEVGESFSTMPISSAELMDGEEENINGTVSTNNIKSGVSLINQKMVGDAATPAVNVSSRNYDFDSFAITSLTPENGPSLPASSIVTTSKAKPKKESDNRNTRSNIHTIHASSPHSDSDRVKATNGFIQNKILLSAQDDESYTLLIEESKADEGGLDTASFVSTTMPQSTLMDSATTIVATPAPDIEFSTNNPSATVIPNKSGDKDTSGVSDETVSLVTAATTESSKQSTLMMMQSDKSDISSTMSQSETTTISTQTSYKDGSPTEIPSTAIQDGRQASQPQGTTLMSTIAANSEDAIMSPTTTSPVLSASTTITPSDSEGNINQVPIDASLAPTITSPLPLQTTTNKPGGEEDVKETDSTSVDTPLACDHNKGLVYSEQTKNCVCKSGWLRDHIEDKCINLVGNECFGDSETSNSECPLNSHCKPQEPSGVEKKICTCIPGYIPVADKSRCMAGWNTDCSSTAMLDISIKNRCHPDFHCLSKDNEAGGKCACNDNRTVGLPHSFEGRNDGAGNLKWGNDQQIKCFLDYGSDCDPVNDQCNDFRFLKCSRQSGKCECADSNNQLYDERMQECVARAGTFCTITPNGDNAGDSQHQGMDLRFLACIGNSTCVKVGNETSQLSGTCKCLDGYDQHWQGYCTMKGTSSFMSKQCNEAVGFVGLTLLMLMKRVVYHNL